MSEQPHITVEYDHDRAHGLEQRNMYNLASYQAWNNCRLVTMVIKFVLLASMALLAGYLNKAIGFDYLLRVAFVSVSIGLVCLWRNFVNYAQLIKADTEKRTNLVKLLDSRVKFHTVMVNVALLVAYLCLTVYTFS